MPRAALLLFPLDRKQRERNERKREVAPDKQRRRETKEKTTQLERERESRGEKYWGSRGGGWPN